MAALKAFLFYVLRKYHIDPEIFSGTVDFVIEISNGEIHLLHHDVSRSPETLH